MVSKEKWTQSRLICSILIWHALLLLFVVVWLIYACSTLDCCAFSYITHSSRQVPLNTRTIDNRVVLTARTQFLEPRFEIPVLDLNPNQTETGVLKTEPDKNETGLSRWNRLQLWTRRNQGQTDFVKCYFLNECLLVYACFKKILSSYYYGNNRQMKRQAL